MARKQKKQETMGPWGDLFSSVGDPPAAPGIAPPAGPLADPKLRPKTAGRRWTPTKPQMEGITSVGVNLLVSAAAGSGKTAMLSERCVHLVCDAPPPYRCDVEELLVVTFTEKAAAEMRTRIIAALRDRVGAARGGACGAADAIAGDDEPRLERQLALAEQAQVSTLHSFCSRLLRQHFHLVGLDPGFTVMDGDEALLMRLEVAREQFDKRYDLDDSGDFQRLVDCHADGNDERLLRRVMRAHEMLQSLVDPQAWLRDTRAKLAEAAESGVDSELGHALTRMLRQRLGSLRERCAAAIERLSRMGNFSMYVAVLQEHWQVMEHWQALVDSESLDRLAQEVNVLDFGRLPAVPSGTPGKDAAKSVVDGIRDEMKCGSWRDAVRFTAEEWRDGMRRALPHAEVFLELVDQFAARYRDRKLAARQLDFSDLERFALDVLRDGKREGIVPSATARMYHHLFKHVLIDEYQDINELQDAILGLLSHECLHGQSPGGHRPNLFCVGDVKQSIYGFRLAEPRRFLERESRYRRDEPGQTGRVIDLQSNFRSRAPLLEAINGVFRRLMTRESADIEYDRSHELTAGREFPGDGGIRCFSGAPIELHLLPDKFGGDESDAADDASPPPAHDPDEVNYADLERIEREAVFVARRIRQIVGMDGSPPMHVMEKGPDGLRPRPARPRDVVILLRSMKFKADQFADVLRLFDIPTHSQSSTGYFASVEVRDVLALLAVLDNQQQDVPLAAVLRGPISGLARPEDLLARVRLAYSSRQKPVTFHEAVRRYAAEKDDELAGRLREFLTRISDWRLMVQRRPLADAIWAIYQQSGYLAYVSGLIGGEQRVANLLHLHERAARFGSFQQRGLRRFLEYLESVRAESDLGEPSVAGEAEDVVRVMSVHRSKGLEFPIVVLPDLGKAFNLQDSSGSILVDRHGGLGMSVVDEERQIRYESLASTLVRERARRQSMAEELRVLYVAMTRAREHLILVGTCGEGSANKWRDRWCDHARALPAATVTEARTVLDWLGPVSACSGPEGEIIRTTTHGPADVAGWQVPAAGRQGPTQRLTNAVKLDPLDPPPPAHPEAEAVISRLSFRYPHDALAARKAVQSVTSAAKAHVPAGPKPLPVPKFMRGRPVLSAADVGTATHLVLQHLDFSATLDAPDIAAQIDALLENRMLDAAAAARVDRDAILWFVETEVGRLLRANASRLLRELPVYFAAEAESADVPTPAAADAVPSGNLSAALDEVMVRGRLDVFLPLADGGVIVDYKTDSVDPGAVADRAEQYRGQVGQYRKAMRKVAGIEAGQVWLVFLTPRMLWGM